MQLFACCMRVAHIPYHIKFVASKKGWRALLQSARACMHTTASTMGKSKQIAAQRQSSQHDRKQFLRQQSTKTPGRSREKERATSNRRRCIQLGNPTLREKPHGWHVHDARWSCDTGNLSADCTGVSVAKASQHAPSNLAMSPGPKHPRPTTIPLQARNIRSRRQSHSETNSQHSVLLRHAPTYSLAVVGLPAGDGLPLRRASSRRVASLPEAASTPLPRGWRSPPAP
mmetsp:Transcript_6805/g.20957  ORF Transcript_6805/g.20957 Transcript_6805/m.20957 type:complete len:228 (+) Transcript_6805:607-1290(+)